ncbi:hypothetical protein K492DRAFT_171838 [Lichtheimia hyalospora FSU 10163]|nr:hypothetical protein K492DRAFT_171838 [Lichtheimia hyalospora FSU 10163]
MTGSISGGQLVDTGMHYASRCVNAKGQGFSFNRLTEEQDVPFTMASRDDVPSPDRHENPVPAGIRQIIRGYWIPKDGTASMGIPHGREHSADNNNNASNGGCGNCQALLYDRKFTTRPLCCSTSPRINNQ